MTYVPTFTDYERILESRRLFEAIEDAAEDIEQELEDLNVDELSQEEQAALLMKLVDADGDFSAITDEVKESRINEEAGPIIHAIEYAGAILGNIALIHTICEWVSKHFSIKMDATKAAKSAETFGEWLRKRSGKVSHAIEHFFSWVAEKLGFGHTGQEIAGLIGAGVVVIFLAYLGTVHFPVFGKDSFLKIFLSMTGLAGKAVELFKIGTQLTDIITGKMKGETETAIYKAFNDLFGSKDGEDKSGAATA